MSYAHGVLPDRVIRDPRASAWLVFVDLAADLGTVGAQQWLQQATAAVSTLTDAHAGEELVASVATAIGPTFPAKAGVSASSIPLGLSALPSPPPGLAPADHDVLFYVMSTSDAAVASFLCALDATRPTLTALSVERGYQRGGGRETFGLRDGLRNVNSSDRHRVIFVNGDAQPEEPDWANGGTYLAYLKIEQDVHAWMSLTPEEHAQIIGRRDEDGSRLDLPPGTDPRTEAGYVDPSTPPANAHIRKAGPRGPDQDPVAIFRRGTPYIATDGGALEQGLQFVSFQATWDAFTTILNRWMLNAGFPAASTGVDALLDPNRPLVTFRAAGYYFTVPHDDRYLGAGMFDPDRRTSSHIVIRKTVTDAGGVIDATASLEGATFQVSEPNGQPVGGQFHTDAAGYARSDALPIGVPLTVTEITPPAGAQVSAPQTITLDGRPQQLAWPNTRTNPPGQYG